MASVDAELTHVPSDPSDPFLTLATVPSRNRVQSTTIQDGKKILGGRLR